MSTARQRLKSPSHYRVHQPMATLLNTMVMNVWLTSFPFHVNRPSHSWDKAISDSDLEISTPWSRSWVWSKRKIMQSTQYHINSLRFHFTSIRPTKYEKERFFKFDLKTSKVNVMSEVTGQGHISCPVSNRCTYFSFHINRTNHSWDMAKIVFHLEKTHPKCLKNICQNIPTELLQNLIR